jgi:hypothetical protein
MSTAFCNNRSKTAAAVAITIEANVVKMPTAVGPAESSPFANKLMYSIPNTIKPLSVIAQYFMFLTAFTAG